MGLLLIGLAVVLLASPKSDGRAAGQSSVVPLEVSFAAPELSLQNINGKTGSLSDFRGNVVLVNNWATWCPPCKAEMPALEALWRLMKDKDFTIVGVSGGEDLATVKKFVESEGYTYPIYADPSNRAGAAYGVRAIPTTLILDKSGKVIASKVGGAPYDNSDSQAVFYKLAAR